MLIWNFVALFNKSQHIDDYGVRTGLENTKALNLLLCIFSFSLAGKTAAIAPNPIFLYDDIQKERTDCLLLCLALLWKQKFSRTFQKTLAQVPLARVGRYALPKPIASK